MKTLADIQHYSPAPDALKDKVILVTGAGGGIGGAIARGFAAHGATVLLLGRSESRLAITYDAINDAGHPLPALLPFDLEKAPARDYDTVTQAIADQFGQLHGLVHTAAMLGALTPLAHFDPVLWSRILQVNLNAPFLLTRSCQSLLAQADYASVIFTLNDLALKGRAYWGAYSVAQAGLRNLAEIFADEIESNTTLRVNTLMPGPVRSRLRALAYPGEDPNTLPEPATLLPYYLYLMADDSHDVRGRHLDIPPSQLAPK